MDVVEREREKKHGRRSNCGSRHLRGVLPSGDGAKGESEMTSTQWTPSADELAALAGLCGLTEYTKKTAFIGQTEQCYKSTGEGFYCSISDWHPESNPAHSWRLMEKLIAATPCLSFFAEEIDGRFTVENHRFRNSGATTAEALCKLALEVWENEN